MPRLSLETFQHNALYGKSCQAKQVTKEYGQMLSDVISNAVDISVFTVWLTKAGLGGVVRMTRLACRKCMLCFHQHQRGTLLTYPSFMALSFSASQGLPRLKATLSFTPRTLIVLKALVYTACVDLHVEWG